MSKRNGDNSTKRVLTEFIQIYRSEPCLWMTKSTDYRDRLLKEAAYERLSAKLREIDSTADREKVVKKINSLRTNYRKEKKKLEEHVGKSSYQPRLWYYHLFDFLEGHEWSGSNPFETNDSQDTFGEEDAYESDPLTEIYNELDEYDAELQQPDIKPQQQQPTSSTIIEKLQSPPQSYAGSSHRLLASIKQKSNQSKRTLSNESSDESDYISLQVKEGVSKKIPRTEDRHDVFARMVAIKLRSLNDNRQRLLAEKAINDALFMAEMGELTLEHVNAPLNITASHSDIEYMNPSTSHMDGTGEMENNGLRVVYPGGRRF